MKISDKTRIKVCCLLFAVQLIGALVYAQNQRFREKEVQFHSDSVMLAGTIIVPAQGSRHPGIVFLHGSGPSTREGARPYAEAFAELGIASLIFDKRGCGSSGGSWETSSLEDLSNDALAAVRYLKTEGDIDGSPVGLWGVSQAGWVETLAASRSSDVGFMIVISGGGASPRESELFSYGEEFDKAGLSQQEKSEAFSLLDTYYQYLESGEGRSRFISQLNAVGTDRLAPLAKQLEQILPSEGNRKNWRWVASWDPAPSIEKITCPVLLMFGDMDKDHPTAISIKRWRDGLKKSLNKDVTVVVFPGAGHGLRMREGFTGSGRAPFADGYSELMLGWLWQHVITKKQ